ncbi:MAG TPA: HAMP domain-containing sensor histidine kinase [Acidimicrobiales bacterium]|nr:HAMP domain-containing sensor histidine kinase [Acidimicrobiales bacterium]
MPRRHRRLGLRARVTAAFALGALALSVALSTLTYFTARQYFLSERQTAVLRQAYVNANLARAALRSPSPDIPPLLASLDTAPGSRSVLYDRGRWFATSLTVGRDALPAHLRTQVTSGTPASQRFKLAGSLQMGVGIPIPVVGAAYFEVFSLQDLDNTLRILALTLAAGSVAITIAGVFIGRWASGRTLRPLGEVAQAAVAIAGGRLDTRLETFDEADLATLASSFNRMADRLQERIEREARFTSDVSHELRSPLTTLSTAIGVLEARRDDLPQRSRQALDLLAAELSRFQRMVADLLEISRFDAGSAELSLDEVRVDELVQHAVQAGGNGAFPVEVAPDVAGLQVSVDKRRIERVVANLVENAAVYAGGVTRLAVEASHDRVRLIVEDAGPGIPAEGRERVFERFFRGSASGRRGAGDGSGLGLALVAEHVHLHGGRVWVDDRPGGGSRFVVELPIRPETGGPVPKAPAI